MGAKVLEPDALDMCEQAVEVPRSQEQVKGESRHTRLTGHVRDLLVCLI